MLMLYLYAIVPPVLFFVSIGYLAWHWAFVKRESQLHKWLSRFSVLAMILSMLAVRFTLAAWGYLYWMYKMSQEGLPFH